MGGGASRAPTRSLKARAIQLLAQREHSRLELRRKLLPHALAEALGSGADGIDAGPEAAECSHTRLDAMLDWLEANQYLSQQRFVESRVHARAARFGDLRIKMELAKHGVDLSPEAASALKNSEFERAQGVWQRKYGLRIADAADRAEWAKQARFLAARGFSADVIRKVLREAEVSSEGPGVDTGARTATDAD